MKLRLCSVILWSALKIATTLSSSKRTNYQLALCASSSKEALPLVLIPGFAQSLRSYQSFLPVLSQGRDVLLWEPIWDAPDVSLPTQAQHLQTCLEQVWPQRPVIVAGFSMGGRIALYTAAHQTPSSSCLNIQGLHLTGVGLEPSPHAQIHFTAWKKLLQDNTNLRGFAYSAILATHSPHYLMKHRHMLPIWVDGLCHVQTCEGLLRLLEQTHDPNHNIMSTTATSINTPTRLCVGQDDRMSPVATVVALAQRLGATTTIVDRCDHAVPFEASDKWRQDLVDFCQWVDK